MSREHNGHTDNGRPTIKRQQLRLRDQPYSHISAKLPQLMSAIDELQKSSVCYKYAKFSLEAVSLCGKFGLIKHSGHSWPLDAALGHYCPASHTVFDFTVVPQHSVVFRKLGRLCNRDQVELATKLGASFQFTYGKLVQPAVKQPVKKAASKAAPKFVFLFDDPGLGSVFAVVANSRDEAAGLAQIELTNRGWLGKPGLIEQVALAKYQRLRP